MKASPRISASSLAKITLGLAAFGAATGVAFASWVENGAAIFMATADAGLAWCF